MRILHVAAMPYPTPQGTQALVYRMLRALGEAGHDVHLLCYPHGDGERSGPFTVHRSAGARVPASFRSGPSLRKLLLDAALGRALRQLRARLRPSLIIAHHVEAAALALGTGVPALFYAHTSLREELPTYFPPALQPVLRLSGERLDTQLTRRSQLTWAVSPLLARQLTRQSGREVIAPPLPWAVDVPPIVREERAAARVRYELAPEHEVALYAGNLDAYQGLAQLVDAFARVAARRPRLRWLVATASPLGRFMALVRARGIEHRMRFAPLDGELARRRVHAASDFALVPRAAPGGVPIKLFDALARGVPTIAASRALAGLPLAPYCSVVERGWEGAIEAMLAQPAAATARAALGRAYLAEAHRPERFAEACAQLAELSVGRSRPDEVPA